jgi:hypothetical protein
MCLSDARQEHEAGSAIRPSQATSAGGLSGCPRGLRPGAAAFAHLDGALRGDLLPPRTRSAGPSLSLGPALGGGTHKDRIDRVALWTRPPAPTTLHGLGPLGGWALTRGGGATSRRALGTRRGWAGVRSLGLSHVWDRVGGRGAPVGWPARPGRPRSRCRLPGLRVGRGPYSGRPAAVFAHRRDHRPGPPGHSWCAHRPPRVALAAPVGVGPGAGQGHAAPAWGERWRGREGAAVVVASPAPWLGCAL